MIKGPRGDPPGVYHSEQRKTAEFYMRSEGPVIAKAVCRGVLLQLRVSALTQFSKVIDPHTGKYTLPGNRTARWNRRTIQSCSEPENVELEFFSLYFGGTLMPDRS